MAANSADDALADRYRTWSIAEEHARRVDPRWKVLKNRANEALHAGDIERAVAGYTEALAIADGVTGVTAMFDALSTRDETSAGSRLVGMRDAIEPIVRRCMSGPIAARGEPNKPAAICLANRASAYLKAGRAKEAVGDARAATKYCPEYVKGHHRLMQALHAAGDTNEAAVVQVQLARFRHLSDLKPGFWLGFRLVLIGWLDHITYLDAYESPRSYDWLCLAQNLQATAPSPVVPIVTHSGAQQAGG